MKTLTGYTQIEKLSQRATWRRGRHNKLSPGTRWYCGQCISDVSIAAPSHPTPFNERRFLASPHYKPLPLCRQKLINSKKNGLKQVRKYAVRYPDRYPLLSTKYTPFRTIYSAHLPGSRQISDTFHGSGIMKAYQLCVACLKFLVSLNR